MEHFADIDRMVAAVVGVYDPAFDMADRALDEREAVRARAPMEAVELRDAFGRKAPRDLFLVLGEHVDGEVAGTGEAGIALRRLVDADERERRVEGQRGEGVGGEAEGRSRPVPGRH